MSVHLSFGTSPELLTAEQGEASAEDVRIRSGILLSVALSIPCEACTFGASMVTSLNA